jgi:hypothetical protein
MDKTMGVLLTVLIYKPDMMRWVCFQWMLLPSVTATWT